MHINYTTFKIGQLDYISFKIGQPIYITHVLQLVNPSKFNNRSTHVNYASIKIGQSI